MVKPAGARRWAMRTEGRGGSGPGGAVVGLIDGVVVGEMEAIEEIVAVAEKDGPFAMGLVFDVPGTGNAVDDSEAGVVVFINEDLALKDGH